MPATTVVISDPVRAHRPTCVILIDGFVYDPMTRYLRLRNFSLASERGYARSVCQLMNWTSAAAPSLAVDAANSSDLFNSFLHDLLRGTKRDAALHAALGWRPSSPDTVKRVSHCVAEFSDWLATVEPHAAINPATRVASATERLIAMKAFGHRKSHSMLGHLHSQSDAQSSAVWTRQVAAPGRGELTLLPPPAFPVDRIEDLLWKGFENERHKDDPQPWIRWNLRDILITMICLYGGTRQSEPLHLWVDDVFADPSDPLSCKVLIHSPEEGRVDFFDRQTGKMKSVSRMEYLEARGKQPLTMATGRRHAGWKGGLLTDPKRKAFEVFWISPDARRLFRRIWDIYVQKVRPPMPNTPWAFLTKDGEPLGTAAYADSFKDAVEKIGLIADKASAGTPHALRHRYGQWLNELGVSDKAGQVCMHHSSIQSQETYRRLSLDQIAQEMASKPLANSGIITLPSWSQHA